jgi:hypothetical protein
VTPSPTPVPTQRPGNITYNPNPTSTATDEPTVIEYTPDPEPEQTPDNKNFWEEIFENDNDNSGVIEANSTPTIEPLNIPESKNIDFLPWIIGSLVIAGITLIFIVIGILKEASNKRSKPPLIKV